MPTLCATICSAGSIQAGINVGLDPGQEAPVASMSCHGPASEGTGSSDPGKEECGCPIGDVSAKLSSVADLEFPTLAVVAVLNDWRPCSWCGAPQLAPKEVVKLLNSPFAWVNPPLLI